MRYLLIPASIIFTMLVVIVVLLIKVHDLQVEVDRLDFEIRKIETGEEQGSASGGAETQDTRDYRSPADSDFVFPILESDFLRYTSPYGIRKSPFTQIEVTHRGMDIAGVWKAQVVAAADGTVVRHYPPPGTLVPGTTDTYYKGHDVYGTMIEIEHDSGAVSLYAHMSSTRVHQGERVGAGDVIGRIGNTGRSDGPHLHFELHIDGQPVNPLLYIPDPTKEPENGSQTQFFEGNPIPYAAQQ